LRAIKFSKDDVLKPATHKGPAGWLLTVSDLCVKPV
jgi:hypothetical protein